MVINGREVINMGGISELNVDVRQIVRGALAVLAG